MWLEASALKEMQLMPGNQGGMMYKGKIDNKQSVSSFTFPSSHMQSIIVNQMTRDFWKYNLWYQITNFTEQKTEKGKKGIKGQTGSGSVPAYLSLLESSLLIFQPFPALLFNVIQRIFISLELPTNYFLCYCIWEQKLYLLS